MDINTGQLSHEVLSIVHSIPWHWIAAGLHVTLAAIATVHALLYKRDSRAALGWVSVCLFFPLFGPLLYFMLGINRIQTQARKLARLRSFRLRIGYERGSLAIEPKFAGQVLASPLSAFVQISDRVTSRVVTTGNRIQILQNGEQTYPAMLEAINRATNRIFLTTYLFESDAIGKAFVKALAAAQQRGVEVRVILDGIGELYTWPRIRWLLGRAGVCVKRFLPPKLLPPTFSINLRNHRKILVVDSEHGFTGGMNIGARHLLKSTSARRTADLHFHIQGPAAAQLEAIFIEDWRFVSGESLELGKATEGQGSSCCRCISDGPNEDLDQISLILMGAVSAAQHEVMIITPYFLPSREMIASLQSAALRGVDVSIILPRKSNLRFIDWATRNLLWELLQYGVKVFYQPPPFAHTKLFIVDGVYAQIGSANIDPRSLRLNFELNLEIFDADFVSQLVNYSTKIREFSTEITLQEVDGRRLPARLRDAVCWLFMPYL